ncbi:hypothetical protein [Sulfurimonas marina]|uniref:Uncharacterized protein n=1 Tax=Sulfurimonas marina TaxID=2590551 RepID=A0A7M1AWE9_9BACT|nr:hypothetical protein [Sulfurimonas marina]QOP40918.1 hypothetical protein FJR03_03850 [Sulfurimonas marina]
MKKSIITVISLFVSTGLAADNVMMNTSELSWVDEQVEAIKPARVGARNSYLGSMTNPFVFLKKGKKGKTISRSRSYRTPTRTSTRTSSEISAKSSKGKLALEAIINKSALIGGKWYKEGQSVGGYKIERVNDKVVFLKQGKKSIVLSTKSKHKSLKFNNN